MSARQTGDVSLDAIMRVVREELDERPGVAAPVPPPAPLRRDGARGAAARVIEAVQAQVRRAFRG